MVGSIHKFLLHHHHHHHPPHERSKIILNIYYYDHNKVFDYYRLSFLIANNAFIISEEPSEINLEIEKNLIGYNEYMILEPYDKIVETVDKYLQNYDPKIIDKIVTEQYNWFSKNKMENYIMNIEEFTNIK